jgi:hypothetical protein
MESGQIQNNGIVGSLLVLLVVVFVVGFGGYTGRKADVQLSVEARDALQRFAVFSYHVNTSGWSYETYACDEIADLIVAAYKPRLCKRLYRVLSTQATTVLSPALSRTSGHGGVRAVGAGDVRAKWRADAARLRVAGRASARRGPS